MNRAAIRITHAVLLAVVFVLLLGSVARPADDAAAVYKAKCETCHAKDGSGKTDMGKMTKAKDLRSPEVQKMTDDQLNDAITKGMGDTMPAYKGKLTDAQIKALVAYTRGLAKKS
jgi:mono/diheme cytochrome c family protein